jgi:alpha-glucosidase
MFFERPDDPAYRRIEDQFLLGDSVLVAPILTEGARSRMVALPPGTWYRYGSGTPLAGGRTLSVTAGLDLPLFVRAGTVLPLWPVRQSTSQPLDRLILQLYRGQATSRLYEDEGDGFGYRDGKSLLSTFVTSQDDRGLTVNWTAEGSYQRPAPRVDVRLFGWGPSLPQVRVDDQSGKTTGTSPTTITTKAFRQLTVSS